MKYFIFKQNTIVFSAPLKSISLLVNVFISWQRFYHNPVLPFSMKECITLLWTTVTCLKCMNSLFLNSFLRLIKFFHCMLSSLIFTHIRFIWLLSNWWDSIDGWRKRNHFVITMHEKWFNFKIGDKNMMSFYIESCMM